MRDRKEVARMYIDEGHKVAKSLKAAGISPSSYYFVGKGGRRGRSASEFTRKQDGTLVNNAVVLDEIRKLLSHEFVDYGYIKVTHWLRKRAGYLINKKKVYRLMREHKLLNPRRIIQRQPRLWVQELVPQPDGVFEHLEIDIKYLHIHGTRSNVMQLTVIDVKTRYVLGYMQGVSLRKEHVIRLFEKIFAVIELPKSYYVRCDNGSQFTAQLVRAFFESRSGAKQEFCYPATPQQNAHIEAFHSIVQSVICDRFQFEDRKDLQDTMARFIEFYNTDRIHSGINYESPVFEVRRSRPNFEPKWVADYADDKPLLGINCEGLALAESAGGRQSTMII